MQIFQHLKFSEFVSERFSEVRKRSRVASVLLLCFTILVIIFNVKNSTTTQNVLQSFRIANPLNRTSQNTTIENLRRISHHNSTASASIYEQNNNGSKSTNQAQNLFAELHSEFVKQSCLSRYQSSSYRKSQPYNPSPYLISKLRDYQKLHARCGPHSSSYRRFIQSVSSSSHEKETTSSCKYLVWTPANGLGNRMISIAAAFLYSILESRVFLVDFEADMDDLYCEPFPQSSWLLPENFPYKNNFSSLPSINNTANLSNLGLASLPIVHLYMQYGYGDALRHHFHCNDTQIFLKKIPVLILKTDQYFVPSLFTSPIFNSELNRMFPKKGAIFHLLSHYLFNPSNDAWGLITRFYQTYLANSDQIIGLQIRAFTTNVVPYENIMSQILSCVQDNDILPSLTTNSSLNFPSKNHTTNSKAVLVVSLYPEFSERLRNMYLSRPTETGDVVGVYQPSHEEHQKSNDNMHNMKAWVEIYLLSLCDSLVTSGFSTFGYVAKSLAGSNSWIMKTIDGSEARHLACKQSISPEPCFHFPATHDCNGKNKIENITAVNSNLYNCEDFEYGIKLVD